MKKGDRQQKLMQTGIGIKESTNDGFTHVDCSTFILAGTLYTVANIQSYNLYHLHCVYATTLSDPTYKSRVWVVCDLTKCVYMKKPQQSTGITCDN